LLAHVVSNGDWQFLCGGDHSGESDDKPLLDCLENVVLRDPSLNELAAMPFALGYASDP
jgi:hypothetical protein